MESDILNEINVVIDSLKIAHQTAAGIEKDRLSFQLGEWCRDESAVPVSDAPEAIALMYWSKLKTSRFDKVRDWLEGHPSIDVREGRLNNSTARYLYYNYQILREDFSFIETLQSDEKQRSLAAADHIALGRIAMRRFDYDAALDHYRAAREADDSLILNGEAIRLTSLVLSRQLKFQECFDTLMFGLGNGGFSDDLLYNLGRTLIRLGKVSESTRLFQLAVEINPFHEDAHYFLGNGYAPFNYTQLTQKYPQCFPDSATAAEFVEQPNPDWVRPYIVKAEDSWITADLETAESLCRAALDRCPDYGRAHAMLAKVYEGYGLREKIYYQSDNLEFDEASFPDVPQIEEYVLNWDRLSERHRKRVAISIAPWKNFLPVLVATRQTHYIKPIHEKLSECPFMEEMANQRINLDSRLWDDVRGAGGYNTVTGIEDVERMIFHNYNTVLHELTHQVHGILTEPEKDRIEETFRTAKARQEAGTETFMSRYQASNEWEYFAEGVNAYFSHRHDENDPREIVRERLFEMDTALVKLVEHFISIEDISPYYAVGMVRASNQLLERAKPEEALEKLKEIPQDDQENLTVLTALSRVYSILDRDDDAVECARRAVELYPSDAGGYQRLADAYRHSSAGLERSIAVLKQGLEGDVLKSRHQLFDDLGGLYREAGRYDEAIACYDSIFSFQGDSPSALWGLGVSWRDRQFVLGLEDKDQFEKAVGYFDQVVPRRSGNIHLRLDYACLLLLNSDLRGAKRQVDQAANIRDDDPLVWCYQAWLSLSDGDQTQAENLLKRAVEAQAPPDLARVMTACLTGSEARERLLVQIGETIPYQVFNPRVSEYVSLGRYPAWMRRLLETGLDVETK